MRLALFTSNSLRHKYFANRLAELADEAVVVCEVKRSDADADNADDMIFRKHFQARFDEESRQFAAHSSFNLNAIPIVHGEVNFPNILKTITEFEPDATVIFGSSIIREPLLSFLPTRRTINLHLGMSPYYRGSGTNFWPFVNSELEYVGATLLHLDAGVDKGAIICHARPVFSVDDDVHTIGCKTVKVAVDSIRECLYRLKQGRPLPGVEQWSDAPLTRYYRRSDVTAEILERYQKNIRDGVVAKYLEEVKLPLRMVQLEE